MNSYLIPGAVRTVLCALLLWQTACTVVEPNSTGQTSEQIAAAATLAEDNPSQILFWSPQQQLANYKNIHGIYPTRTIASGERVYPLRSQPTDFSTLTYQVEGQSFSLDDYIKSMRTVGLIVVQNDKILLENYSLGNNEQSLWMSFSIAKSVTSMLIGAAVKDGYIKSIDEPITDYLPRLKETGYANTTIRNLLNMASGVAWNEDYADASSDVSQAGGLNGIELFNYLAELPASNTPGDVFNYSTGETHLVGALLRAAIGNNASTYLSNKIWRPFGMQADATWMLNSPTGGELGGCCISATLRDYARLGIFALKQGQLADGGSVLPDNWMVDSTSPSKGMAGYGYLWWLTGDGSYSGRGIFGQMIFIDTDKNLVIAMHSAWPTAVGNDLAKHRLALIDAIRTSVK